MIRNATRDDIPRLVELGRMMHMESPRFRPFKYLGGQVSSMLEYLIDNDNGLVLVAQHADGIVGGLMAMAMPHYACELMQASDLALFVHPDYRGGSAALRLVGGYREWAESIGAEPSIGLNTGVQPERTAQLLAALGGEQTGTIWTWGADSCASARE